MKQLISFVFIFLMLTVSAHASRTAILFFHGGGWSISHNPTDPEIEQVITEYTGIFESTGYDFIYVDYPLMEDGYNGSQILNSINEMVKGYAGEYDNLILFGISAGGHLALTYSLMHPNVATHVIAVAPPTDLTIQLNYGTDPHVEELADMLCLNDDPVKLSPIHQLYLNNTRYLIISNVLDETVNHWLQANPFLQKLEQLGMRNEQHVFNSSFKHAFYSNDSVIFNEINNRILQFIEPPVTPQPFYSYHAEYNHFYIAGEHDSFMASIGYVKESASFKVYYTREEESLPLNRYYNGFDHFYTTERDDNHFSSIGYLFEREAAYVFDYYKPGTVPVYSYYNHNTGDHYYTSVLGSQPANYDFERIRFYAFPN